MGKNVIELFLVFSIQNLEIAIQIVKSNIKCFWDFNSKLELKSQKYVIEILINETLLVTNEMKLNKI